MNSKNLFTTLTALAVVGLWDCRVAEAAQTFYVDSASTVSPATGSETAPYTTIQEAVDAVTESGSTILIQGGSGRDYNVSIGEDGSPVNLIAIASGKSALTLRPWNDTRVTVKIVEKDGGSGFANDGGDGRTVLDVKADGVTVAGFDFVFGPYALARRNPATNIYPGEANLVRVGAKNVTIEDCTFTLESELLNGGKDVVIQCTAATDTGLTIRGCTFDGVRGNRYDVGQDILLLGNDASVVGCHFRQVCGVAANAASRRKFQNFQFVSNIVEVAATAGDTSGSYDADDYRCGLFWSFASSSKNCGMGSAEIAYNLFLGPSDNPRTAALFAKRSATEGFKDEVAFHHNTVIGFKCLVSDVTPNALAPKPTAAFRIYDNLLSLVAIVNATVAPESADDSSLFAAGSLYRANAHYLSGGAFVAGSGAASADYDVTKTLTITGTRELTEATFPAMLNTTDRTDATYYVFYQYRYPWSTTAAWDGDAGLPLYIGWRPPAAHEGAFEVDVSADYTVIIIGSQVVFTATPAGASGDVTCDWDFDGDSVADAHGLTVTNVYGTVGYHDVTVTATDSANPGDPAVAVKEKSILVFGTVAYVKVDVDPARSAVPYATELTAAPDIATALSAVPAGIRIVVCPGEYVTASELVVDKAVTIEGQSGEAGDVTVSPAAAGRILTLDNASATVSALTFKGGRTPSANGGGALVDAGTIDSCVFSACSASGLSQGGGVYIDGDSAEVMHCVFTNCYAAGDSVQGLSAAMAKGRLSNCLFLAGHDESSLAAATVYATGGVIDNCTLVGNQAKGCGGVQLSGIAGAVTAVNTVMFGNSSDGANPNWKAENAECFHFCAVEEGTDPIVTAAADNIAVSSAEFRDYSICDYVPLKGGALYNVGMEAEDFETIVSEGYPKIDLRHETRVADRRIEIGCYEVRGGGGALRMR